MKGKLTKENLTQWLDEEIMFNNFMTEILTQHDKSMRKRDDDLSDLIRCDVSCAIFDSIHLYVSTERFYEIINALQATVRFNPTVSENYNRASFMYKGVEVFRLLDKKKGER